MDATALLVIIHETVTGYSTSSPYESSCAVLQVLAVHVLLLTLVDQQHSVWKVKFVVERLTKHPSASEDRGSVRFGGIAAVRCPFASIVQYG